MEELLITWAAVNILILVSLAIASVDSDANFSFVNPIVIYNHIRVNWFGAWLLAIVCNVVLPTVAIPYWIYKVCTVGRKDNAM